MSLPVKGSGELQMGVEGRGHGDVLHMGHIHLLRLVSHSLIINLIEIKYVKRRPVYWKTEA
jgi:hypothetical protein